MRFSPNWEEHGCYELSEEVKYLMWVKEHYPTAESAMGQCAQATKAMALAFPELRRVPGLLCHGDIKHDLEHWWLVTPSGEIVDPTRHQYNQMFLIGYYEITVESPIFGKMRHRCRNCGDYFYDPGCDGMCSKSCSLEAARW